MHPFALHHLALVSVVVTFLLAEVPLVTPKSVDVGSGENVVDQCHYQPILLGRRRVGGGEQVPAHHRFFLSRASLRTLV